MRKRFVIVNAGSVELGQLNRVSVTENGHSRNYQNITESSIIRLSDYCERNATDTRIWCGGSIGWSVIIETPVKG